MMVAATRGMVCREKTKRFMRIPPHSIPKAAAGRFIAPVERQELVCVRRPGRCVGTDAELDHGEGARQHVPERTFSMLRCNNDT